MIETPYGRINIPVQDTAMKDQLLRFGAHQRTDLDMLLAAVDADDVVLDLGAHVGTYTVPLAQRVREVVAVEADPGRFRMLEENVAANVLTNVRTHNCLVAATPKTMSMQTGRSVNQQTLDPLWVDGMTGAKQQTSVAASEIVAGASAPATVIKSDLEGMDLEVISAVLDHIREVRPVLCVEFLLQGDDARAFFHMISALGYELYVNLALRNSSMLGFVPYRVTSLEDIGLIGIYDIFARPAQSGRAECWAQALEAPHYPLLAEAFYKSARGDHEGVVDTLQGERWEASADTAFLYGKSQIMVHAFSAAAQTLREAINAFGENSEAYSWLARTLIECGAYKEAKAAAEAATRLNPNDHMAFFVLARCRHLTGEHKRAIHATDRALRLYPEGADYMPFRVTAKRAWDDQRRPWRPAVRWLKRRFIARSPSPR